MKNFKLLDMLLLFIIDTLIEVGLFMGGVYMYTNEKWVGVGIMACLFGLFESFPRE